MSGERPLPPDLAGIARLLAEGVDDHGVARTEAIAVRTVRRRVARLHEFLGTQTRFQAGYVLGARDAGCGGECACRGEPAAGSETVPAGGRGVGFASAG